MYILLNGKREEVKKNTSLQSIIKNRIGIAVAINEKVIPNAEWPSHIIEEGDRIEVITAFQGG